MTGGGDSSYIWKKKAHFELYHFTKKKKKVCKIWFKFAKEIAKSNNVHSEWQNEMTEILRRVF